LVTVALAPIAVGACGSPGTHVSDVEPTSAPTPTSTPTAVAESEQLSAAESVRTASLKLTGHQAWRVTTTTAQTIDIDAFGTHTEQELDPSRPTVRTEIAANGDTHVMLDLGPLLGPIASSTPELADELDSTHVELWTVGDTIYIDATGYQPVADLDPDADLGPFEPGRGTIDLTRVADVAGDDVVRSLVGNDMADPVTLAAALPDALDAVSSDPDRPGVFTATATYAAMLEAWGTDVSELARRSARPIARLTGSDEDEVAAIYERADRSISCDVTITVGPDGALAAVDYTIDASPIFAMLADPVEGLSDLSATERMQMRQAFDGAVWTARSLLTVEADDAIRVTPPTGDFEDRTDEAIEFFG
jgi:hypothetical protein